MEFLRGTALLVSSIQQCIVLYGTVGFRNCLSLSVFLSGIRLLALTLKVHEIDQNNIQFLLPCS